VNGPLDDGGMTITRLAGFSLAFHKRKPFRMLNKIGLEIQSMTAVADGDIKRPAQPVMPLPFLEFLRAWPVSAEAAPYLPLHIQTRPTALVPRTRDCSPIRHDFPYFARKKPAASQRLQE